MPINVKERPRQAGTVQYKRPTATREYIASGSTDRTQILLAIAGASPAFDVSIDAQTGAPITIFREKLDVKECGGGVWEATIHYESSPNSIDVHFTFGVQNHKIYTALETIGAYDCIDGGEIWPGEEFFGDNIPNFHGAIGVTGHGGSGGGGAGVEGVDIEVGKVELSVAKKWKRATLPMTYVNILNEFTDRTAVNDPAWTFIWLGQQLVFPKGSLRFRGAPIKQNSDEELEITYNFAYSGPITLADNFRIGNSDRIEREGWQYGWTFFRRAASGNRNAVVVPQCHVINKVYPYRDFTELLI